MTPVSGLTSPASTRISVDLPAPFSPISAWTSPDATAKSTPFSARTPPNALVTPLSSTRLGMAAQNTASGRRYLSTLSLVMTAGVV